MKWAKPENGVVTHILWVPPETIFYPETASLYVVCGDEVEVGWTYNGTTFAAPVIVIGREDYHAALRIRIEARREQRMADFLDELLLHIPPPETVADFEAIMDGAVWPNEF